MDQPVKRLSEQQLGDPVAVIVPDVSHGGNALHGGRGTIGACGRNPFQCRFGKVGSHQQGAGIDVDHHMRRRVGPNSAPDCG